MIRERVSTQGVIRPLEPEADLAAFALPHELVGVISELAIRRYQEGRIKFDKKFRKTTKTIEKDRKRNLEMANKDAVRNMTQLQMSLQQEDQSRENKGKEKETMMRHSMLDAIRSRSQSQSRRGETPKDIKEGITSCGSLSWAWALDIDERPPPSSIVSRRDTDEAVRLAKIADQCVLMEENMISGNNLWSMIVNFLTVTPDKKRHSLWQGHHQHKKHGKERTGEKDQEKARKETKTEAEQRKVDLLGGGKDDA